MECLLLLQQNHLAVTKRVSDCCLVCGVVCNLLLVSADGVHVAVATETPGSNESSKQLLFGLWCGV